MMKILLETAPHESAVAERLAASTARYRGTLAEVADRLHQLGALKINTARATDVLWFYFGYAGLFTLTQDNGWGFDDAQTWLLRHCTQALIGETFDDRARQAQRR